MVDRLLKYIEWFNIRDIKGMKHRHLSICQKRFNIWYISLYIILFTLPKLHVGVAWLHVPVSEQVVELNPVIVYPVSHENDIVVWSGYPPFKRNASVLIRPFDSWIGAQVTKILILLYVILFIVIECNIYNNINLLYSIQLIEMWDIT